MARLDGPEPWGVAEIAAALGIRPVTVHWHIREGTFPEPWRRLKMGPVWRAQDVLEWRGRSRG